MAILAVLLIGAIVFTCIDISSDGVLDMHIGSSDDGNKRTYKIVKPDWETDIYTIPEYLELNPDIITYTDGVLTERLRPAQISSGTDIAFLKSYFDAMKQGDNEALNACFSESCLSLYKDGGFDDFPMQKVYDIQIEKRQKTIDQEYENKVYDYQYYLISYKIYKNDGLFQSEVDERWPRKELVMVITDAYGNRKIEKIRDLSQYL